MAQRNDPPRRQRGARKDSSVGQLEEHIEKAYKLPKGAVQINNPGGRNSRSDQKVGNLKDKWNK